METLGEVDFNSDDRGLEEFRLSTKYFTYHGAPTLLSKYVAV
jgi:hypothetical protein